jgi:CRP-like cAMP-binding protein
VYFLTGGKVRVIIYSSEGKVVVFRDLRAPAMFGEIAAIDGGPRSASIEVVEACTVASLSATEFERLLLREPTVAVATLRHITAEVRKLSERVVEFSTLLVSNRIHAELLRLVTEAQQQTGEPLLSPAPSLADIANRVSSHREAVSRELSRLGALGLIRREGTNLRVLDRARLEALVRDARGE